MNNLQARYSENDFWAPDGDRTHNLPMTGESVSPVIRRLRVWSSEAQKSFSEYQAWRSFIYLDYLNNDHTWDTLFCNDSKMKMHGQSGCCIFRNLIWFWNRHAKNSVMTIVLKIAEYCSWNGMFTAWEHFKITQSASTVYSNAIHYYQTKIISIQKDKF